MTKTPMTIRQGDVALVKVDKLPEGCELVPNQESKIILAWGEVTFHHHRIEDHVIHATPGAAEEIAEAAISRAQAKARLWKSPNGETFLEVRETVHLTHEEHSAHAIPPGIYKQPTQVEYSPAELRRVAD
jgi:hypothetical protein